MPKLKPMARDGAVVGYAFWCQGCNEPHTYYVVNWRNNPVWTFNGNLEKPTFTPSLLYRYPPEKTCHLFLTDGNIQYLGDCSHELKGRTVPLQDWPL